MKKLALSAFSIALLVFITSAIYAIPKNDPLKKLNNTPSISYVVKVIAPSSIEICHSYFVTISDVSGNLVAPPQMYQDGIDTYVFYEKGPVAEGRIANLVELSYNHVCGKEIITDPDAIFHKFMNSVSYSFYLYPRVVLGDE